MLGKVIIKLCMFLLCMVISYYVLSFQFWILGIPLASLTIGLLGASVALWIFLILYWLLTIIILCS